MLDCRLHVPGHSRSFAALGAAYILLQRNSEGKGRSLDDLIEYYKTQSAGLKYFYSQLELKHSVYPDFSKTRNWIHRTSIEGFTVDIQVEEFCSNRDEYKEGIIIGMDVGSTSTKAVVSNISGKPLLGYYTYTSGRPVQARAASHLDPETDTIIEIGGQDAKFTVMKRGEVVFSQMNSVCAAGTGSFIEEQAKKLGVPLSEYADRAMGVEAPLTSDRCTVFMERDLNYFINRGYTVEELLCATLYSVRENYLKKVATEGMIGKHVCFQGATARNRAL